MIAKAATSTLERHQVAVFFVLAYVLSWGSVSLTGGPGLFAFGPFLAALATVAALGGWSELRQFILQACRWHSAVRWYVIAVFLPVALAAATVLLNAAAGATMPISTLAASSLTVIQAFPVALVDAPLWEELAWRGYALPRFSAIRSRVANTLLLAVLLAGWHLPLALSSADHAMQYVICTLASAIVTNCLYYMSGERALIAVVFHATQNSVTGFFLFEIYAGVDLHQWWWIYAGVYSAAALFALALIRTHRAAAGDLPAAAGTSDQRIQTRR